MSEEQTNQQPQEEVTSAANPAEETQETAPETTQQQEQQPAVEKQVTEETPIENINTEDTAQVAEVLNHKGFDLNELQSEFDEYGDITEETRDKLAKVGITKEILDSYIEGRWAIVEKQMDDIANSIGGKETFESVINWAKANLSEEEKTVYSNIHDPAMLKIAVRDLKNRMENSDGIIPQQIQGSGDTSGNDYFQSMAEVEEAINNPKYAKDEVYRQKVAQKITASREAGILELK